MSASSLRRLDTYPAGNKLEIFSRLILLRCSGGQSTVYRWSKEATNIIVIVVKNGLRPKVMLRNLRDRNCFANYRDNDSALQQDYKHQESVETDRQHGQYSPVTSKTPAAFRGS